MAYFIGIDIGTSGTKTLLIDQSGKVIATATDTYPLSTPRPLWAEQNPDDWWRATASTIREVLSRSGVASSEIKGIGLSGQMHGAVFLDDRNQVLRPSILWCDQRTGAECDWLTEQAGIEKVVDITCNPVLTGFTAGKIIWLRNHEPETFAKVAKVLLPKDYVRLKLTGEFATEVSDASGTSLFDVKKRRWSEEMLEAARIPKSWMPPVYESPEISGKISEEASALTGLKAGTPVVGGGGDQAAGAVGNGIVETGIISSTIGTSGVVFAFSEKPVVDPKLRFHTFCHAVPGKWHIMGVMLSAGGSLRWYRDTFDPDSSYDKICAEASAVEPGCEGLFFLPYLTGERTPYPDPNARGAFIGATLRHSRPHFARAVMEGVAYGLNDSFEILKEMKVAMSEVRASGGGAKSETWRQIQSDITGLEHMLVNVDEGPAFGVALLASVGTGVYSSVEEACKSTIKVASSTMPDAGKSQLYQRYRDVYRSLYPALKDQFARISCISG